MSKSDYCKVSDFGASQEFSADDPFMDVFIGIPASFLGLVSIDFHSGTVAYMAPEVVQAKPYTKAVDMWAIGVVTYCMLSGITPFGTFSRFFTKLCK
jgi:serine/threonine protein kinase